MKFEPRQCSAEQPRSVRAWLGSAFVHGALLAALLAYAPVEGSAVAEPVEVAIVELLPTMSSSASPLAERATSSAAIPSVAPAIPMPRRMPAPPRRAKPRLPQPPAAAPVEAVEPAEDDPPSIAAPPAEEAPAATSQGSTVGAGSHAARGGGGDPTDHSAYGAEIVRILKLEIDRDPVAGISARDSIQLLLTVLPNGDLEWTRDGRFGFAEILRSSLGPVRTRQLLRRIERASAQFPGHPDGLRSRRYVVEVTIRFGALRH